MALTNPTTGATLGGEVGLFATAEDDIGIVRVQFSVDGALLGTVLAAPFGLVWNTADVSIGPHTVTAVAFDAAGHETAASAEVIVENTGGGPPMVTN